MFRCILIPETREVISMGHRCFCLRPVAWLALWAGLTLLSGSGRAELSYEEMSRIMGSFEECRVLLSALELDIFTAVGKGATAPQVAQKLRANPRSTETFLNSLAAMGALTKREGVFRNTAVTARYFDDASPESRRLPTLHTADMWKAWSNLTESVRAGTGAGYEEMSDRDNRWTNAFIAAMHHGAMGQAASVVRAVGVKGVSRLLDIGGGSGAYSIAFAQANPALRAEVLDLPKVVPIARKYIEEAGLSDRITTRIGDLRKDDFGRDYDLLFLSAICHMLSPDENRDLLRRCHRALKPGGRVVIRDFVLGPDKTTPKWAALFALNMLVATQGGGCYSEEEYTSWLRAAGFEVKVLEPSSMIAGIRR